MIKETIKGNAREQILLSASTLFYQNGIRATGIDAIIAQAGVTKKTFYYHFASKDDLIVAFIERRDAIWRESLPERVAQLAAAPAERVLALFDLFGERFRADDFRGCAFTNTIIETADPAHPAHQAAVTHKDFVKDYLTGLLRAAGADHAETLAYQLLLLIDGSLVTALREGTPKAAVQAKHAAATLLRAAGLTAVSPEE
ncbi:MAG TPA: TetR/AcrR family transcriptional regulator [Herpetosiphonaceae bacterium]|nr:TetR/AcrR family transcriptional regulator [Herpetosiphonaceae bacterium]